MFCLSVLALAGGGLWLWQGLQTLEQPVALDEPVLFSVPSGSGYGQVARKLEAEGLVGDSLLTQDTVKSLKKVDGRNTYISDLVWGRIFCYCVLVRSVR